MDELERKLKRARLAVPSGELDRRIGDEIAAASRQRKTSRKTTFWWWMAALATAGSMAALLIVSGSRPVPAPETAVIRIEAQGRMREMLVAPSMGRDTAPQFQFRVNAP
jgi:hypothetical protein